MKIGKNLFILFVSALAILTGGIPVSAEYTGPNSGARRYSYEVEVQGTCDETYSCCTAWSSESCGTHEWDIGCCTSYGTCHRSVDCTKTETVWVNHPDASISVSASCSTGFGNDGWCAGDVTVTAKGSDSVYQITGIENSDGEWQKGSKANSMTKTFTFSGEQMRTVEFWAHSGLGDTSSKASYTVKIDQTYPVNDITVTGNTSGGWYYGPVTITSTAQDTFLDKQWVDAGFGQKENSDTIPETFSGMVTPKSKSVDLAGNAADWTSYESISIDNEKPAITNFIDPKGKWFNYPVPLSVSGTDQYSGVRTGYIVVDGKTMDVNGNTSSLVYSGSQGMHEVEYQLEDFASNKSAVSGPYSFGFDTVLPEIQLDSNQSFDIIGPVVTISGTVTDNASGIKSVQIKYGAGGSWMNVSGQPASGTLEGSWSQNIAQDVAEGYNNFFVRTTDIAGNVSQVVTFTLRTDKTPPETVGLRVEGDKGPGEAYRGKVTFIGEAEDSVAGVKSIFVDLGLGDGEKPDSDSVAAGYSGVVTACVRVVDNVGNSTECVPQNPVTVDNENPIRPITPGWIRQ